jgi:lysophospholipase L1-like esterase
LNSGLRKLPSNLLLSLSALAVGLLLLEVAARLLLEPDGLPSSADYTQHDPLLGWSKRPGARVRFPRGDYAINSHGLRDRERVYRTARGTFRLLALGDSFVEGMSVRFEDSVAPALERELARPGCAVEVINGGTVAWSTDQEYLFYRELGVRYEPRVVLLFLYHNDVLYNGRADYAHRPKPLLAFRDGEPYVKNAPVPRRELPPPSPVPRARVKGSLALGWLSARLRRSLPDAGPPPLELGIFASEPPREVQTAWEHTVAILRALARQTSARGARLLVVYVPAKMEVSEREWALARRRYGLDEGAWDRSRLARLLREAGQAVGFPVLDPTAALRAVERGWRGGPYHTDGGHWNALGHATAARAVAAFLRGEGWVPCPAASSGE